MKNPKQLVFTSIIATLILSNAITGNEYSKDVKKYESTINNQLKLIKQLKVSDSKNKQLINQKSNEINSKNTEINNLNTQLDQIKNENDDLKKQLQSRKEVENRQRKLNIQASAYISSCRGCTGNTYTGYNVSNTIQYNGYRIIAADLSVIPLYSIVRIDTQSGSFNAVVLDTGSAIKNFKIDLLVGSYQEAIQFGRQNVTVTILREGDGNND
jgi:3D (Asp-Asp-Asp) domain-containing protein